MNKKYIDKIILDDCKKHLSKLDNNSIDLFLSDIPYGINLDDWDVLHNNTNSALLGASPAQEGKSGFKKRGKPINGWAKSDRNFGLEYEKWCEDWSKEIYKKMKKGSSLFVFGGRRTIHRAINAFEKSGFLLKDILSWKKPSAHHRAQRVSIIYEKRGLLKEADKWKGWRLGNLAPIWEPIAWLTKPYDIGGTIADNILENKVGAINTDVFLETGAKATNLLDFRFRKNEKRQHEAQKPLDLIEFLIKLTTLKNQIVLDPFMGSGTTAIASKKIGRKFIGFEISEKYHKISLNRLGLLENNKNKKDELFDL